MVPTALAVGVSLAGAAQAGTVNPVQATTYNLSTANNPITFGTGTNINATPGNGVQGDSSTAWNVTNQGGIAGQFYGVTLDSSSTVSNSGSITGHTFAGLRTAGGDVTNTSTGSIYGFGVGVENTGIGTVTNAGTITGYLADGVLLGGGTVTNQAGASIIGKGDGDSYGVAVGDNSTVTNSGTISGTHAGVTLSSGSTLNNEAGGVIRGGVRSGGFVPVTTSTLGAVTINNAGTIYGGTYLRAGGTITNQSGGVMDGAVSFVPFYGPQPATVTVTNQAGGTMTGGVIVDSLSAGLITNDGVINGGYGIQLSGGGTVTNSGQISSSRYAGILGVNAAVTVTNSGSVSGAYRGVSLLAGGTVTDNTGGAITGGREGVYASGASASVTNAGTITGTAHNGVGLFAGGSVENLTGGQISGGNYGVYIQGGDAAVTNAGSITGVSTAVGLNGTNSTVDNSGSIVSTGKYGFGVNIKAGGGTVTNETGGYIGAARSAIAISGGAGAVTNSGVIQSTTRDGVFLGQGGSVANNTGASIKGYYGVVGFGDTTVTNAGAITATGSDGVAVINGAATVNNQAGGAISGNTGVYAYGGALTLTNAGTITGTGADGVMALAGGSVANAAGGAIAGAYDGVYITGGDASVTNAGSITGAVAGVALNGTHQSVDNSGSIKATGAYGVGVGLSGPGAVTNDKGGYIGGSAVGVIIAGDGSTVTNSGSIQGGVFGAALVGDGGQVANAAGATISSAGAAGLFSLGATTLTNAGTISDTNAKAGYGVALAGAATVTNQAGGAISGFTGLEAGLGALSLTNAGSITGTGGDGVAAAGGATVDNQAGGAISGATVGLYVLGGATVTNAGSIGGGTDAIVFAGPGANTLTLDTGSVLSGDVIGSTDAAATNALVLQGAGEADDSFVNFGSLTAKATGPWVLGGASAFGAVEVDSGMLVIDGALAAGATTVNGGNLQVGDAGHAGATLVSPVTVNAGGVLSGHGTVVGDVSNNGGTVAPGGSVGTLTIAGDYTQSPAGTLAIELTSAGSSRLVVTGAAHLAGTLLFDPISGVFRKGQVFDFLDAGAVDGAFSTITFDGPQIFAVSQVGDSFLATATVGNFALQGGTANQRALVAAFNNYPVGVSDFDPLASAIIAMPAGAAQNQVVNELGSEISPDLMSATRTTVRGLLGDFTEQLASRQGAGEGGSADPVWLQGIGRFGSTSSDGNAHGFSDSSGGVAGGVQHDFGSLTAGGAVSWQQTWLSLNGLPQSGNVSDTSLGVYGEERAGTLFVDLGGLAGFQHGAVKRLIAAPGVAARQASGDFDGLSYGIVGRVGDRIAISGGWTLEPRAGLAWTRIEQDSYSEAGAGGADLDIAPTQQESVQSLVGLRVAKALATGFSGEASLDWAHEFDDLTPRVGESFSGVTGTDFTMAGVNPGRDAAVLRAGVNYKTSRITFYARYDGSFSNRADDNAVTGGLRIAF